MIVIYVFFRDFRAGSVSWLVVFIMGVMTFHLLFNNAYRVFSSIQYPVKNPEPWNEMKETYVY